MKKIKINKPELINSVNMCMSGIHIKIEYMNETENEYQYKCTFIDEFKFSIFKDRCTRGEIYLGVSYKGKIHFYATNIETLKDRNKFLDWTVKNLESLCLQ
jgi:hypothetical protein